MKEIMENGFKYNRVLLLYTKLIDGEIINKKHEAEYFGVNERTIQRDIDDLRMFFENRAVEGEQYKELVYSRELAKYGDTYELYLTNKFKSLDEMLAYMRSTDFIDQYNFKAQLKWNVNDHTAIFVSIYALDVEIEYRSIESTGGTGFKEDSLI